MRLDFFKFGNVIVLLLKGFYGKLLAIVGHESTQPVVVHVGMLLGKGGTMGQVWKGVFSKLLLWNMTEYEQVALYWCMVPVALGGLDKLDGVPGFGNLLC